MKKLRIIKKRNTYLLGAMFFASTLLFCETHPNTFLKDLAEQKMKEVLPEDVNIRIGGIQGGVFRSIVSENVRITKGSEKTGLTIERVEINYRLWYPLLKRVKMLSRFASAADERKIYVSLGTEKGSPIKGFFELEDIRDTLCVRGFLDLKGNKISVKGKITAGKPAVFRVIAKNGMATVKVFTEEDALMIKGKINHAKICGADIVADFSVSIDTEKNDNVACEAVLKNIVIDYEPLNKDIKGSFNYEKGKNLLNITRFTVSDDIKGHGCLSLNQDHYVFLKWSVTNTAIEKYFVSQKIKKDYFGTMNGNFCLKGPVKNADFLGHFDVQKGRFGGMTFDSVIVNLKGKGPLINVYESRVLKEGGYIAVSGEADLSRLKENKAFEGIKLSSDDQFFMWDGWSVLKEGKDSSVKAEKPIDSEFNISFQARTEDTQSEEERFIGVEHKLKF